jgi:hypothetical protein
MIRDGLFAKATGNPEVPRWIGKVFIRIALSVRKQNEKDIKHVRSSAGIAVFSSEKDDKVHCCRPSAAICELGWAEQSEARPRGPVWLWTGDATIAPPAG